MPHKLAELGTYEEWLRRAKSNLALARVQKTEDICWEDLCFETQQAAEKAIKAVLIHNNIQFRFVHDIAELLTLLEQNNIQFPEEVRAAAELTDYAVEARYPGPFEAVSEEEFLRAFKIAATVVSWAESQASKLR
ncbi:MAG: HEPN domain-containing protein [Deltaproteobacteria bacterium]|nr:HEPN domain-containing protein [Deltaproteobacteria bacterium]